MLLTPEDARYLELEKRVSFLERAVVSMAAAAMQTPPAPEPPKQGLPWDQAVKFVQQGKRVYRKGWDAGTYVEFGDHAPHITLVTGDGKNQHVLSPGDLMARDWEVLE